MEEKRLSIQFDNDKSITVENTDADIDPTRMLEDAEREDSGDSDESEDSSVSHNTVKSVARTRLAERSMRKSFMRRSFARLGTGSLRGSIFSLSAAAIGSGVLTFPHIVKVNGWFFGLVMILMGGASCFLSHYMLIQSARHHSLMSYNEISEKAGGPRLQKLLQISVMTYIFATCLACTIVCKASILFICCFRLPNLASLFP